MATSKPSATVTKMDRQSDGDLQNLRSSPKLKEFAKIACPIINNTRRFTVGSKPKCTLQTQWVDENDATHF